MGSYKMKVSVLIPAYNAEKTIRKAIDSTPDRKDVEIMVWDDGSEDDTFVEVQEALNGRKNGHFVGISYENHGVAYTVNRLLDNAEGEFVVLLGSDDWFIKEAFEDVMDMLRDDVDLVYFDLEINDGTVMELRPDTKVTYCGSTKFMRREFVGDTRCIEQKRAGEDWFFYQELLAKNPRELFSNIVVKHYNFPRKNSLSWKQRNGKFGEGEV